MRPLHGSLTVMRIGRIPIRVHWSLWLILPYLAFAIGHQFQGAARLAGVQASRLSATPYLWGLGLAVALFACVLLHELSHVAVGLRVGAEVRDVTLMMLGGVTNMTRLPRRARLEGLMAVAGPFASGLLAAGFLLLYHAVPARLHDLRFGCFYLGEINLVLAVFNLLPAFPMDGGRILRALFQIWMGRLRATQTAAQVGRVLAVGLGALGLYSGNFVLAFIAVFVFLGAGGETAQIELEELIGGLTVRQVMERHPPMVDPQATVAEIAARMTLDGSPAFFVVMADGSLLGALTAGQLRAIPAALLPLTHVTELMRTAIPTTGLDRPLEEALRLLAQSSFPLLPVVEGGRLVGAVGPQLLEALRREKDPSRAAPALRRREA